METPMAARAKTFLLCHGAWSGGWAWTKMHPLVAQAGHRLVAPTYTGLGERAHLANPAIDLETHIQDILNVIAFEDLRDIVLLGHSYGGMVATGVADRARDRISQLIYLDAFVPEDGQSLLDLNDAQFHLRTTRATTKPSTSAAPRPSTVCPLIFLSLQKLGAEPMSPLPTPIPTVNMTSNEFCVLSFSSRTAARLSD